MQYSYIRSRAGLVALIFALIISLVSAVPIPVAESGLSSTLSPNRNPSLNGQLEVDTARSSTKLLTRRDISTNMDDQLVRRSVGSKIKKAFQNAGHAIKSVAQKVGNGIKKVAQKVGNGIKTAANKVKTFAKNTGAKIVKFGAKVVQTVGEAVGHVASFIPEIGKPIQQAIHGISKVAGVVSDSIHTNLSKKLQKGMNVMNKAGKIMSFLPRSDFSEEEDFQQRDIGDVYSSYFEERDDIDLENREEYFEANERDIYERYDLD